jgi:hypothetical protein
MLCADFSVDAWHYRRSLTVSQPAPISEFPIDATLYRNSAANLDDLRILKNNSETPYVIVTLAGSHNSIERPAAILNKAYVPGAGVQAILDLKSNHEHNRLRIATHLHNFKENVRVETSDDSHTWAVAQASGIIFDISRDDHAASETTVSYPLSTRRFVRVTIPGWTDPNLLESVWLSSYQETDATIDTVATVTPTVQQDSKTQTTDLLLDLGFPGQPYDHINLSVDPGLFSRTVEVSGSNDKQHWFYVCGGLLSRTSDEEHLFVQIPERTDRYLKLTVFNGDSEPLHFGAISLTGIRRVVKFPSVHPGIYVLYIGNSGARTPSYDFSRVMLTNVTPSSATLGELETNPQFHAPDPPWTDRNPWLLNGTLVVAVIAMGVISLRMFRKIKSPGQS